MKLLAQHLIPGLTAICMLALSACETVVSVDVPEKTNLLVVNGLIIPDQQPQVSLSRSYAVLGNEFENNRVSGASMLLFEEDVLVGAFEESLVGGNYVFPTDSMAFRPKGERNYRVSVTHPDYPPAIASTQTPPANLSLTLAAGDTVSLGGDDHLSLVLTLRDPDHRDDFYWFELFVESDFSGEQLCFRNLEEPFETVETFFPDLGELPIYCGRVYRSDDDFNGQDKTFEFLIPLQFISFFPVEELSIRAVVGLLSEDLYRFELSERLQANSEGDPFAQPVVVHNNVEGGFGLLGGFNARSVSWSP